MTAIAGVKKIALLRVNALGDFIFCLPAIAALRETFPGAEITFIGRRWHDEFLREREVVDRVVVLPKIAEVDRSADGRAEAPPEELVRFFQAMAAERFDIALQMHGGGLHSNRVVRALGARCTAGLKTPDAPALDRWMPYVYYQNEVFRCLEVAALVGAHAGDVQPRLQPLESDLEEADRLLGPRDSAGAPLVVLHPEATDPRRKWPPASFAAAGDALADQGATVAIVGTPDERHAAREVRRRMRASALDLCGRTSVSGLVGVVARASIVIANDSGPLYVACALGTPAVGIYWCGNVVNAGPPGRRLFRPCISWRLDCPECGTNCMRAVCEHGSSFVADVAVGEVTGQALSLLFASDAPRDDVLADGRIFDSRLVGRATG